MTWRGGLCMVLAAVSILSVCGAIEAQAARVDRLSCAQARHAIHRPHARCKREAPDLVRCFTAGAQWEVVRVRGRIYVEGRQVTGRARQVSRPPTPAAQVSASAPEALQPEAGEGLPLTAADERFLAEGGEAPEVTPAEEGEA